PIASSCWTARPRASSPAATPASCASSTTIRACRHFSTGSHERTLMAGGWRVATEAHKFQVGVFVIVVTGIAIATVIWLGASRFFEQTKPFVTYFSESVQGLEPGSALKYRGVPSGR